MVAAPNIGRNCNAYLAAALRKMRNAIISLCVLESLVLSNCVHRVMKPTGSMQIQYGRYLVTPPVSKHDLQVNYFENAALAMDSSGNAEDLVQANKLFLVRGNKVVLLFQSQAFSSIPSPPMDEYLIAVEIDSIYAGDTYQTRNHSMKLLFNSISPKGFEIHYSTKLNEVLILDQCGSKTLCGQLNFNGETTTYRNEYVRWDTGHVTAQIEFKAIKKETTTRAIVSEHLFIPDTEMRKFLGN